MPEAQIAGCVVVASAPSSSAIQASPFAATPKASELDVQPHGHLEVSHPKRFSQRSGLQRNSFRLLCRLLTSPPRSRALRPAQSGLPDTTEISRGKTESLRRTPAGFTTPPLDDHGLRDHVLARPAGQASLSGSCQSPGLFAPRFLQTPPRDDALALR